MFNLYKHLFQLLFWLGFGVYFIHHAICAYFYKTQNLKKRYNAQWALVTGASSGTQALKLGVPTFSICKLTQKAKSWKYESAIRWYVGNTGIGKSIAKKLAKQGLNVVLVALGDQLLDTTFEEFKSEFPSLQFRKVWWFKFLCCTLIQWGVMMLVVVAGGLCRSPWTTRNSTAAAQCRAWCMILWCWGLQISVSLHYEYDSWSGVHLQMFAVPAALQLQRIQTSSSFALMHTVLGVL